MPAQRCRVVLPLVAEGGAERFQPALVAHKPMPDPVADVIAEGARQGAVGLVHPVTSVLTIRVVRLADVDADEALVVADQHRRFTRQFGQEEGQAAEGIVDPVAKGDAEAEQRVE